MLTNHEKRAKDENSGMGGNLTVKVLMGFVVSVVLVALYFRYRLYLSNLRVTSWFRTPWHNYKVGGVINSQHLIGWAFDVTPVNNAVHDKLRSMGFRTVIREVDHIHVSIL